MKNKKFLISIASLMLSQAFFYWFLKFFQNNPNYIYFSIDQKIPLISNFIFVYNTFYPFVFIAFYYLFTKDKKNYYKGIIAGIFGFLLCDIIYLYYPTIMQRPIIPETTNAITSFVLKITYFFDTPALNCFPSIHCLFCFQIIFSFIKGHSINIKNKTLIIIYSLLIIFSTIFVKQHYVVDIIGALLVCIITNLIVDITKLYDKIKV